MFQTLFDQAKMAGVQSAHGGSKSETSAPRLDVTNPGADLPPGPCDGERGKVGHVFRLSFLPAGHFGTQALIPLR